MRRHPRLSRLSDRAANEEFNSPEMATTQPNTQVSSANGSIRTFTSLCASCLNANHELGANISGATIEMDCAQVLGHCYTIYADGDRNEEVSRARGALLATYLFPAAGMECSIINPPYAPLQAGTYHAW